MSTQNSRRKSRPASKKTATAKAKGAKPPKATHPGKNGGTLNSGWAHSPGRPPDEFKRAMRAIVSSDDAIKYLDECVKGVHGPKAAVSAQKYASERGYGRVPLEVTGEGGGPVEVTVTRRVVRVAPGNRIAPALNGNGHGPTNGNGNGNGRH